MRRKPPFSISLRECTFPQGLLFRARVGAGNPFEAVWPRRFAQTAEALMWGRGKRKVTNMNMKYQAKPTYEQVDIVGKTVETITGTIDRKAVARVLLTTQAGFEGKHEVVNGDGTAIRTVKAIGENEGEAATVELFVRLVGDIKSLASYKFFAGYVGDNAENAGVKDLYTENGEQISKMVECARRMCASHPECDDRWEIVDGNGVRHFLRLISKTLTANGKIAD